MTNEISVSVPTSWSELSQEQLRFLLQSMAKVQKRLRNRAFKSQDDYAAQAAAEVATLCFLNWSGMHVICPYGKNWLMACGEKEFVIASEALAAAIRSLSWSKELPKQPVRLDSVDGAQAVPADLCENFSFNDWLSCETLWQAYQATNNDDLMRQMAEFLYQKPGINPDPAELIGIFYWWAAVKLMVSELFPNFFQPSDASGSESPSADDMRRSMDAQIRALTKGDITKENEILQMPAMRALTELDAQAREYEELNRKYPKK